MRIGIDISQVVYGTGVSFYTRMLVKHLLKLDSENSYCLFGGALRTRQILLDKIKEFEEYKNKFTTRVYPFSPSISDFIFNKVHFLPIETFIGKIDVFHSSDWVQPKSNCFNVTTIHDLAPIIYPKLSDRSIVEVHKRRIKRIFAEVDRVIVPSKATENELLRVGYDSNKIRVIYEAPGDAFKKLSSEEVERVKDWLKIRGKYILAVGVGERKNTKGIIKGFDLSRAGKDINLVIAGDPDNVHEVKRGVIFTGMLNDYSLASLYSGAEALVFPSFYEGFGLPILQAFACECPVVTSNTSSMFEIAADAAVLVDPHDASSIAEGILKALQGPKGLIQKGMKRVKDFSWEKAAKQTIDVYKEGKKLV